MTTSSARSVRERRRSRWRQHVLAAAALAMSTGSALATFSTNSQQALSNHSLIAFGNLTNSSNIEGRTIVGGSLFGAASDYATRLAPTNAFLNQDTLIVGGNINISNVNLQAGNLRQGGVVQVGNINFNGGGQLIRDTATQLQIGTMRLQLTQTSDFLRTQLATSPLTFPTNQPRALVFNAAARLTDGVAIFNVNGNQAFNNPLVQQMEMNLNGVESVIINVSGSTINWTSGNMIGGFTQDSVRAKVLWNFYEATSISLGGRAFGGAILAPRADLNFQGVLSGTVVANNIIAQSEVHLPGYTGFVPAPGATVVLAMGGIFAGRRRR